MSYASAVKRREKGQCWHCTAPAAPGYAMCVTHLERERERMRKRKGCKPWRRGFPGRPPYVPPPVEVGST